MVISKKRNFVLKIAAFPSKLLADWMEVMNPPIKGIQIVTRRFALKSENNQ